MRKVRKIEPAAPLLVQKKKVAAYARVSMGSERLMHSLSAQVSFYSSLIQGNPEWEYAGVYVDSGVICQTIRQEKYTGNTLLQKFYVEEGSPRKGKRNNGELPMYYVEGTHPAIISREVFDRAQQEMAARYGVEVRNGRAEPAGYLYHGGDYEKPDYHFRRPQWTEEQRRRHAEMFTEREKR